MAHRIFDLRMGDSSRHFGALPETYDPTTPQWDVLREHVEALPGARLTGFVTDRVTEAWIDFVHAGQRFSLNNQHRQWWFFVADPGCNEALLEQVLVHFAVVLDPTGTHER